MNWGAMYKWIISNQVIFDWIYGTTAFFLVVFVFVEVLRGRLLSPSLGREQRIRARAAEEDCILPNSPNIYASPDGQLSRT